MKKRSIAVRLGVAAMALTMITTSMSSGTLAKYTAKAEGSGAVYVARWNVKGKIADENGTEVWTSENESTLGDLMTKSLTLDEKIAKMPDGTSFKIAPGTKGGFALTIDPNDATNHSTDGANAVTDVAIDYAITMNIKSNGSNGLPENLRFYKGKLGDDNKTIVRDVTAGDGIELTTNAQVIAEDVLSVTEAKTATTAYVFWEWEYEQGTPGEDPTVEGSVAANDLKDNSAGEGAGEGKVAGTDDLATLNITMKMVQHDPSKGLNYNSITKNTYTTGA